MLLGAWKGPPGTSSATEAETIALLTVTVGMLLLSKTASAVSAYALGAGPDGMALQCSAVPVIEFSPLIRTSMVRSRSPQLPSITMPKIVSRGA